MNILAIETATPYCSVALETSQGLFIRFESTSRQHAQQLLPMVDSVLQEANFSLAQLNAIAVSIGPGSFTGLRIGAGVVQGLAFAHETPIIPVSTLATVAQGAMRLLNLEDATIYVVLDAHMKEFFCGKYSVRNGILVPAQEEQLIAEFNFQEAESDSYLLTDVAIDNGSFPGKIVNLQTLELPSAVDVITLAKRNDVRVEAIHLQPVYLRTEKAWKKAGQD